MTPAGRDNGLPRAARYVALVDVEPALADEVLSLLRDAGVPAQVEADGGTSERVHVDGDRADLARAIVADALPDLAPGLLGDAASDPAPGRADGEYDDAEVDSLFAGIVAGWDTAIADPVPRWSALEDVDEQPGSATDTLPPVAPPPSPRPPLSSRLVRRSDPAARRPDDAGRYDGADDPDRRAAHDEDDDDSAHDPFVPPEPPPLPEVDRVTRLAWAALIGGPTLIILAGVLGIPLEGWLALASLGLFLGGFATLVARMRDRPRDDDGWDDGAVL
jgi:hypothetical protein